MKRILLALILIVGCTQVEEVIQLGELRLTSPSFEAGGKIPAKYSCEADNVNPELNISGIPEGTVSLALIMDDPDAPGGTWVHWVVWNIPVTNKIAEDSIPGTQGKNSWNSNQYGGPCPPSGTHRYVFKLYALNIELELPEAARKQELEQAMTGHILASTQLMGTYNR